MAETDLLNDLMSSNPNSPATNSALLLLRAETKSEFKAVQVDLGRLEQRMGKAEQRLSSLEEKMDYVIRSLDSLAQNMALLLKRLPE